MLALEDSNVAIVGLVRDLGSSIKTEVLRINERFSSFANVSWILIESDSRDNTLDELQTLKLMLPNFSFQSLGALETAEPDRIRRLAKCRNAYVELLSNLDPELTPDWVAVLDLDSALPLLSKKAIEQTLTSGLADAYSANQAAPYYDLYALRASGWVDKDPFLTYQELLDTGVSKRRAYKLAVSGKMVVVRKDREPIPVESAFGGLTIYDATRFAGCRYSATNEFLEVECEHVAFNRQFTHAGGRLVIAPNLVVAGYNQHTRYLKPWRRALQPGIEALKLLTTVFLGERLTHRIGLWLFAKTGI